MSEENGDPEAPKEKEVIDQAKDKSGKGRKWWQDAGIIAAIGTVVVGIASFNPSLNNWLTYNLESSKHDNSRRDAYLEKAIDPHRTPEYRISVLRYLVTTLTSDDAMKRWAEKELADLEASLKASIESKAAEIRKQIADLEGELKRRQESLSARNPRSPQQRVTEQEIQKLKAKLDEFNAKLIESQEAIKHLATIPIPPTVKPSLGAKSFTENANKPRREGESAPEVCCITCNGITICGAKVVTECGECCVGAACD